MYQSLFGFPNREAQTKALATKRKPSQPLHSQDFHNGVFYNTPPPYSTSQSRRRIAVVMTSGTETLLGTQLLDTLRELHVESHLIISRNALATLGHSGVQDDRVYALADKVHSEADFDTALFQGGLPLDAMIVVPCDDRNLASIATGLGDDMITRVARLMLARHQRLALMFPGTQSTKTHEKYFTKVTKEGALVIPFGATSIEEPAAIDRIAVEVVRSMLDGVTNGNMLEKIAQK